MISASTGICTGVQDIENFNFSLYPNPNAGQFTLALANSEKAEISIRNTAGQIVQNHVSNSQQTDFDLNLSAGVYFVSVIQNGFTNTQRLVVQ